MPIDTDGSAPPSPTEQESNSPHHHRPTNSQQLTYLGRGGDHTQALNLAGEVLNERLGHAPRAHTATPAAELADAINAVDLNSPTGDLHAAFDELGPLWLDHAIRYDSPRYLAHLNCPISTEAFAGDIVAGALNTAVESWDQAASAALIEDRLIRWAAEHAGMNPHQASGTFTSGGTQSNHQALYTAREKALYSGQVELKQLAVFGSTECHYSIARSAHILGLPAANVFSIPTDARGRMLPEELERELALARDRGLVPMAIVATGGTTDLGAIDPLPQIADICRAYGAHLHVDCAYGGALLLSPTRRHLLNGLEQADTFTLDFHKSFFQPLACSAVIYRKESDMAHVTWHAEYLNADHDPRLNLADRSLQTTRRFDALKLWVSVRTHGPAAIGTAFDDCCALAHSAAALIDEQPDFTLLAQPQLSTLLFRFTPDGTPSSTIDCITPLIRTRLFDEGKAVIAGTIHQGKPYLKFTLLNPTLGVDDIDQALELIRETGHALLEKDNS